MSIQPGNPPKGIKLFLVAIVAISSFLIVFAVYNCAAAVYPYVVAKTFVQTAAMSGLVAATFGLIEMIEKFARFARPVRLFTTFLTAVFAVLWAFNI